MAPARKAKLQEKTIRALLVDDDAEDTLLLMGLMAQATWPWFKFTLECAQDLKSGLEILAKGETEVVLLDLMLPDSQGLSTLEKARSCAPDVPIVVLTGLKDEAMGLEAVAGGAQDYLVKGGVDGHALKRTISYAVERHRMTSSLKGLVDGSADAMVVVGDDGAVRYANPAAQALFGRPLGEILDKPFPYPLGPEGHAEISIPSAEGPARIGEMRVSRIEWRDQAARLASIRDVTDQRRAGQLKAEIQERRNLDRMKDELMGAVAHKIRTPLTVIKAGVDCLHLGMAGPLTPKQGTLVGLMRNSVDKLVKVVRNTLSLSRLESGKAQVRPTRLDAAPLIDGAVRAFKLLADERKIALGARLAPHLPPVHADPDLFSEMLDNLIDNALRFAKSKVEVRADVHPGERTPEGGVYVEFSVIDDGPGVPREHAQEIFHKFVQAGRAAGTGGYKGTGLGLAVCKESAELHEGRIWVEPGDGGGKFHFILPKHEPERERKRGGVYAEGPGKA